MCELKVFDTTAEVDEYSKENGDDTFIVCAPLSDPLYMPDNVVKQCCMCDEKLQMRPNAPKGKPLCPRCYEDHIEEGDIQILVSKAVVKEVVAWIKKQESH